MRGVFFELLKKKMYDDQSIFFLVADMGLGIVEEFQKEFPDRYLNVGICEQNLIGIASGLCNMGFRPVCYTISNFLIQRAYEQIRNDICIHKYPVVLVGASTGFDNGLLGPTHQVIDDIGCLKFLPNMDIYSPSTKKTMALSFTEIFKGNKPAYIRIGKGSYDSENTIDNINYMVNFNNDSGVLIITHGTMLEQCMRALQIKNDFSIWVVNKIKPIDVNLIRNLLKKYQEIIVVEDQLRAAGLYNILCQSCCELGIVNTRLHYIGPGEVYEDVVGDKDYYAGQYGYSPEKLSDFVQAINSQ
jgi:transketolase